MDSIVGTSLISRARLGLSASSVSAAQRQIEQCMSKRSGAARWGQERYACISAYEQGGHGQLANALFNENAQQA